MSRCLKQTGSQGSKEMGGLIKRTGKTKARKLASIHVGLYNRLCVYVLGLGSGQQCGAEFIHWPMAGEGRASANYGSSGQLLQSLP